MMRYLYDGSGSPWWWLSADTAGNVAVAAYVADAVIVDAVAFQVLLRPVSLARLPILLMSMLTSMTPLLLQPLCVPPV